MRVKAGSVKVRLTMDEACALLRLGQTPFGTPFDYRDQQVLRDLGAALKSELVKEAKSP